jgi:hypothetical protein
LFLGEILDNNLMGHKIWMRKALGMYLMATKLGLFSLLQPERMELRGSLRESQ